MPVLAPIPMIHRGGWGWAEFCHGKGHVAEHAAWIVIARCQALLVRDAVFGSMYQILSRADDANHGKDAQRNGQVTFPIAVAQISAHARANVVGNVTAATAAMAFVLLFDARSKYDRINDLDNSDRYVSALPARTRLGAVIGAVGIAFENVDVAFAAVKNHLFLKNSDAVKLLTSSATDARLKVKLHVETNVHAVKAAIKGHGVDVDRGPLNGGAFYSNTSGSFQNIVAKIRQKDPHVFKAISVTARIQYAIGFDTDHFPSATGRTTGGARKFVFCHSIYSFNKLHKRSFGLAGSTNVPPIATPDTLLYHSIHAAEI